MVRIKHPSGYLSETLYLLLMIAPLVVLFSIFGYDLIDQFAARRELRQTLQSRIDDGLMTGNDSMSRAFYDQMAHKDAAAWSDVMAAAEVVMQDDKLSSDEDRSLRSPQRFVDAVDPEAIEQMKRAAPIIDAIERLTEDPKPVWTPTLFHGWNTLLPEAQHFRSIARLLAAEFQVAVAMNDHDRALRALRMLDQFVIITEQDFCMVSALISFAIEGMRNDAVLHSVSLDFWQDADILQELDERLKPRSDTQERWETIWQGELAMAYDSLMNGSEVYDYEMQPQFMSRSLGLNMKQHVDFINAYESLWELTPVGTATDLEAIEQATRNILNNAEASINWTAIPFANVGPLLRMVFPAGEMFAQAMVRHQRDRQWTRIATAIKRFELLHDRWPNALSELKSLGLSATDWTLETGVPLGYEVAEDGDAAYLWTARTPRTVMPSENPFDQSDIDPTRVHDVGVVKIQ
ncbi:MAG: hypothetical protein R3C05_24670 [Pirellulaceae bacterium]